MNEEDEAKAMIVELNEHLSSINESLLGLQRFIVFSCISKGINFENPYKLEETLKKTDFIYNILIKKESSNE